MNMREKMARALCVADGRDQDRDWRRGGGIMLEVAIRPEDEPSWTLYKKHIDAILDAMREPSEEVLFKGVGELTHYDPGGDLSTEGTTRIWQAMIAAIKAGK